MILPVQPNPNIGPDFWINHKRIHVLHGGRSSSKSWDASMWAILLARDYRINFLCVRQLQARIKDSVYSLLVSNIHRMGFSKEFKITNTYILHKKTKSNFVFYGLWRSISEIKGMENKQICWIEEAEALTPSQWEILEPTIMRNQGGKFWIVFNPDVATDFAYQKFVVNPPDDAIVMQVNYDKNPHLSETMLKVINDKKKEDYDEYNHIYLGVPYDDDESVIIKRKWCNAAKDAHLKLGFEPEGQKRIGFDVADDGGDRCVNVFAHGNVATDMDAWKANEDDLIKSTKRTYNNALNTDSLVTYDATGMGANVGSKFKELNEEREGDDIECKLVEYEKFVAGGEVLNPKKNTHMAV